MYKPLERNVWLASKGMRTAITSSVTATDISFTINVGDIERTVERDLILDQQADGSWGINAYVAGKDCGGSISVEDDEYMYLVSMIVELLIDPDKFGTRILRIAPPKSEKDAA